RVIRRRLFEGGVEYDFPQMIIRVHEISGITAIERLLLRLHYAGAGLGSPLHNLIHLVPAAYVVANRKTSRGIGTDAQARVLCDPHFSELPAFKCGSLRPAVFRVGRPDGPGPDL